jgi:periplasmic divalent cation tolerance protein
MEARFCWVMCADEAEALRIGRTIVAERLAACANVLGPARSIYWWQSQLHEASEVALILKTKAELEPALLARVAALHSYECPGVVVLPITNGLPAYLSWIAAETNDVESSSS